MYMVDIWGINDGLNFDISACTTFVRFSQNFILNTSERQKM